MWSATRQITGPARDEDVEMAYKWFGNYKNREVARKVLIQAVYDEIEAWLDSRYDLDGYCQRRLDAIVTRLHAGEDVVAEDGLEFAIRDVGSRR